MRKKSHSRHFKSKKSYKKWVAYGHIHGVFEKTPGNQKVFIAGKKHKVKHLKKKGGKRK